MIDIIYYLNFMLYKKKKRRETQTGVEPAPLYSGTSDNRHSEKRGTSVQRTDSMARIKFSIALILN